jgi:uncharacterized protein (DUF2126 family)
VRWRYNGQATDSGGGGQLTLGGPTPAQSPFFAFPLLLPRLVRYLAHHPALSYAFAPDCVGSAGQGPRPDEGVRERYEELEVALDRLEAGAPGPEQLWGALAPLLVDASGNSHRAELNVEKLWNPWTGARGRLGLVELRALRMPPDPATMTATAALFRAVAARCALAPFPLPLPDHGAALHDRLALPALLGEDLRAVLDDLDAHGLGLASPLREPLLARRPEVCRVGLGDAELALTPAPEFWPLVGDVASQERQAARLVDASSARLEAVVTAPPGAAAGQLSALGWEVPLRPLPCGRRHLGALRYRAFAPRPGLHPDLAPHDPLRLSWSRGGEAVEIALHGWRPGGGAYPGLPADAGEAERRRRERVVIRPAAPVPARPASSDRFTLDVRRLTGADPR